MLFEKLESALKYFVVERYGLCAWLGSPSKVLLRMHNQFYFTFAHCTFLKPFPNTLLSIC